MSIRNKFFKFGFSYCFRNLWRNKRRTLLTMSTVIVSVVVAIVGQQYNTAVMELWIKSTRDSGAGDIQIQNPSYDLSSQGINKDNLLQENNKAEELLDNLEDISVYTKRLDVEGMISSSTKSIYFVGSGITPGFEERVSPELFDPRSIQGSFITDSNIDGVIIGKGLSQTLNVDLQDNLTLMVQTVDGAVNAEDVKVIGILDISFTEASRRTIYLHIDKARSLLRASSYYSSLVARVQKTTDLESFVPSIKQELKDSGFLLKAWWDVYPIILNVKTLFQSVVGIISFLLFLSVSISVMSVIYMLIFERTVEIGTLMAIGLDSKSTTFIIVLEACLIGILGSIVGVILGNIIVFILSLTGIPFDNPLSNGIIYVYPHMSALVSIIVSILAISMCSLSALIPGIKAAKWNPSEAFRGHIT